METRLFEKGTIPEWTTPEWYADREHAPHLEQAGHRERLMRAARSVNTALDLGAGSVCDLGAGDGGLLSLANTRMKWGYDLQITNVRAARERGVDVKVLDVVKTLDINWGDIVVMTEMLEHLIDPHHMVLRSYMSQAQYIVAACPRTETPESHYEYHTWVWDCEGFDAMLTNVGWKIYSHDDSTMSHTVLAGK